MKDGRTAIDRYRSSRLRKARQRCESLIALLAPAPA